MIHRIALLVIILASQASVPAQQLQRTPLQKMDIELKSPVSWEKTFVRVDPQTNKEIYRDHKPRLEIANAKAGKYFMKWIGGDGKEKVVIYQRPDCVDVIVIASAIKSTSGIYEYEYIVHNLKVSGDYLHSFAVQNFSVDISPKKRPALIDDVHIGSMSSGGVFKEGNWIRFAPLPPHPKVQPGQILKVKLSSASPPGLVECRVDGGSRVMKGVGEDLPPELEALLLGFEAWPKGYTIGPIDKLREMSQSEKSAYLLSTLPQCRTQGWISAKALSEYNQLLKQENLQAVIKRVASDLEAGNITSEVSSIVQGLSHSTFNPLPPPKPIVPDPRIEMINKEAEQYIDQLQSDDRAQRIDTFYKVLAFSLKIKNRRHPWQGFEAYPRGMRTLYAYLLSHLFTDLPEKKEGFITNLIKLLERENAFVREGMQSIVDGKSIREYLDFYLDLTAAVAYLDDPRAVDSLVGAISNMRDRSAFYNAVIFQGVAGLGADAIDPVSGLLDNANVWVRFSATSVLVEMLEKAKITNESDPASMKKLKEAMMRSAQDQDYSIRMWAMRGLKKFMPLGDKEVISLLEKIAQNDPELVYNEDGKMRVYPARVLAKEILRLNKQ